MIQKVLVPLDGSGFGEDALGWAETVSQLTGGEIDLVHVHTPHVPDHLLANTQYQFEGVDLDEYDLRDQGEEEEYLNTVGSRMAADLGKRPASVLLQGDVVDALNGYARKSGDGIICLSTHGRSGLSRAWLGSVADTLVRESPWPVLLVRSGAQKEPVQLRRILVPLDGSPAAERVLSVAAEAASDANAALILLKVVTVNTALGLGLVSLPPAASAEASSLLWRYLSEVATKLEERGLRVATRVMEHSHVAQGILQAAQEEEADLVAMATHGRGAAARFVLGSVADKVVRAAECPLLLVGPGVSDETPRAVSVA